MPYFVNLKQNFQFNKNTNYPCSTKKTGPGSKRLTDEEIATRDAAEANKKAIDKAARDAA